MFDPVLFFMLDSTVAMLKLLLALLFLIQDSPLAITSPGAGSVLRGQVQINGRMNVTDFSSAELAFSYSGSNSTEAWFIIQTFSQPQPDSSLTAWDTTSLSDGDYALRLRVFHSDNSFEDVIVSNLQVRNDLPEPTETPLPDIAALQPTSQPSTTENPPTPGLIYPSPTPLPQNPAEVTTSSIYNTFGRGALSALALFAVFSLILRLRKPD